MFDKLIDSAPVRRKRRLTRYFFGTSLLYLSVITATLVISVLVTNPELAHTSDIKVTSLAFPPPKKGDSEPAPARQETPRQAQPDIYHPAPLEEAINRVVEQPMRDQSNNPPTTDRISYGPGYRDGVRDGDPNSPAFIPGAGGERRNISPDPIEPPPPPPPAARQPKNDDQSMMRVPSRVLQGKAIERRTPAYPRLAIVAKVEGSVSVEVVISPDGRVEVARAISGHPLLKPAAAEAARSWRFQPTLLNGVPVRVTGIITFVFKIDG